LAFLYLVSGNAIYARKSRDIVENIIDSDIWANAQLKGLTLYTAGSYVAYAYDHCYGSPSWNNEFAAKVSDKLRTMADVIFTYGGLEQNRNEASNWQGLRFAAAGICYLATDSNLVPEESLTACYDRVVGYLRSNLGDDPGARGWNIEGLGYTYYPMGNGVAPFAVAIQRRDPRRDVRVEVPASRWTLWTCYATLMKTSFGLVHPDFGDDNPSAEGEGCYGFAFWFCPAEIQPGLKWWYDRTVGILGNGTFDSARFGTCASIFHYPSELTEKNPMTIPAWVDAMSENGGNGYAVFRNQYRDETDITAQLYAKQRGAKGHNGPDALSFRIVGLDTIWATGGGRYGLAVDGMDIYKRSQNTLYPVHPDALFQTNNNRGRILSEIVVRADGGGKVTMQIDENNVGSDTSENGHFWQLNTLESNPISISHNTFTITSTTGSTLKGTVIYPAKVPFHVGTRLRGTPAIDINSNNYITFESANGCYLVILTLAKIHQAHPLVSAVGEWGADPMGNITIGKLTVGLTGNDIFVKP